MHKPDKRLNVYRPDLANEALRDEVAADKYVTGKLRQFIKPISTMHRSPRADAMQISQALLGQICCMYEDAAGWAWVQLQHDNYVGYVHADNLSEVITPVTHVVSAVSTFIYPNPDLKTQPAIVIPMNAGLCVTAREGDYLALQGGGFVFAGHAREAANASSDFVAVAEKFLHVPYLWGGNTQQGIDCSGLVQVALNACGIASPRDSDMQQVQLGNALLINDLSGLQRGDLIFWDGHVGIMADSATLLHANGYHMCTVLEPFEAAVKRIAEKGYPITAIKRL